MKLTVIDFETEAIQPRPAYPPRPVSVSIKPPGMTPTFLAWGHPTGNNCARSKAKEILQNIWRNGDPLLFHHGKFDLDVGETHFGLPRLPWELVHDTLYLIFLLDPHAESLGLKPSAEKYLGMKPEERDDVYEWLVEHGVIAKNCKEPGAYISKAPGNVVGPYANGDVIRTLKLFELLYPKLDMGMRQAYDRERRLMPILLDNERRGMRFDVPKAMRDLTKFGEARDRAEAWLRKRLKLKEINFDADTEVGEVLAKRKIVTEWTMTKTGRRSVAKKNMGREKFNDLEVFRVLGYRNRLQTVVSLNLRPWLIQAEANGGYIFTEWNQVRQSHGNDGSKGARTGRIQCSRWMNVSKDFYDKGDGYEHPKKITLPELPLVRRYCLPDPKQVFGHVDYSQQEFRILAHYEDADLKKAYLANPRIDYHATMKERVKLICGIDYERRLIKILNFAINYGTGVAKLAEMAHIDMATAAKLKAAAKEAAPGVIALNLELMRRGREGRPIRTWGGRLYYCEKPRFVEKYNREMSFEYKLLNYLIQGSAADCTKEAIIRYHDMRREARMLVTVHDEINISTPGMSCKQEIKKLQKAMESVEFDVPMLTDAECGPSWGNLKEIKS